MKKPKSKEMLRGAKMSHRARNPRKFKVAKKATKKSL